jgi:hypothetical protein
MMATVFCGIDWAEDHHDAALVDTDGKLIAKQRIGDDAAGFAALIELLAHAGDCAQDPVQYNENIAFAVSGNTPDKLAA